MKTPSMWQQRTETAATEKEANRPAKPRRIGIVLIAAAVVVAMATSNGVAYASSQTTDQALKTATDQQVGAVLRYNPGAKRIGPASVELEKGVVMTVNPRIGAVRPNVSPSLCSFSHGDSAGWLCVYQDSNFNGYEMDFNRCRDVNLGNIVMPNGRPWNDQISSIDNDQTDSVQSRFYNYSGFGDPNSPSNWRFVIAVNAGHYLRDLSKNPSADRGNANDKIDIVHVC